MATDRRQCVRANRNTDRRPRLLRHRGRGVRRASCVRTGAVVAAGDRVEGLRMAYDGAADVLARVRRLRVGGSVPASVAGWDAGVFIKALKGANESPR